MLGRPHPAAAPPAPHPRDGRHRALRWTRLAGAGPGRAIRRSGRARRCRSALRHSDRPAQRGGDGVNLFDKVGERLWGQGLGTIGEGDLRLGVHLDHQPVRARGDPCQRHGGHKGTPAGSVARVDDHGKVAQLLDERHRVEVQGIAGVGLEGPDAALAEDDLVVALAEDVLSGEQPFLDRRRHTPLEQDRLAQPTDFGQQWEVLHVAGTDLQHVNDVGERSDVRRFQHLADQRQAGLPFRLPQNVDAVTAQSLEAVGGGAWLEDTTTERVSPSRPDFPAGFQVELFAVNRAWPGHDPGAVPTDLVRTDRDAGIARSELAVRQFEWLRDGYHLGYARGFDEEFPKRERIRPDYADHRTLVAVAQMGPATMELDLGDDGRHLRRGRVVPHHDDHAVTRSFSAPRR